MRSSAAKHTDHCAGQVRQVPRVTCRHESILAGVLDVGILAGVLNVGHDGGVDAFRTAVLRDVLASTGWVERAREFATRLRRSTEPGGLMLVGTPQEEPWHMAAHLANEAELARLPQLNPTLLRWAPPVTAPVHLTVGVDRLATARRGESVLVITEQLAPVYLLEHVERARKGG